MSMCFFGLRIDTRTSTVEWGVGLWWMEVHRHEGRKNARTKNISTHALEEQS